MLLISQNTLTNVGKCCFLHIYIYSWNQKFIYHSITFNFILHFKIPLWKVFKLNKQELLWLSVVHVVDVFTIYAGYKKL